MFDLKRSEGRVLAIMSFTVAALVMTLSHWHPYFAWDLPVARFIQELPASLTPLFVFVTDLSSKPRVYILLAVLAGTCVALRRWRSAISGAVGVLMMDGFENLLKPIIARPRPAPELIHVYKLSKSFGSPSTTTIIYTFVAGFIALVLCRKFPQRKVRIIAVSVAILVSALGGISRLSLGAHWPSDVLGSYFAALLLLAIFGTTSE